MWSARVAAAAPALAAGEIRKVGGHVLAGAGESSALELLQVQVDGHDCEAAALGTWGDTGA